MNLLNCPIEATHFLAVYLMIVNTLTFLVDVDQDG